MFLNDNHDRDVDDILKYFWGQKEVHVLQRDL